MSRKANAERLKRLAEEWRSKSSKEAKIVDSIPEGEVVLEERIEMNYETGEILSRETVSESEEAAEEVMEEITTEEAKPKKKSRKKKEEE